MSFSAVLYHLLQNKTTNDIERIFTELITIITDLLLLLQNNWQLMKLQEFSELTIIATDFNNGCTSVPHKNNYGIIFRLKQYLKYFKY